MDRPVFQTPDVGTQAQRRLLLISYYFPPDRAVGALRWEKLASYVAARGWGLDVITHYEDVSASIRPPLPTGIRVYGIPLPSLALQRIEHAAWRTMQHIRRHRPDHQETADTPAGDQRAYRTDGARRTRLHSLSRDEIHWALHSPRGYLRAYWAWLDFAHMGAWGRAAAQVARSVVQRGVHGMIISSGPPHMVHEGGRRAAAQAGLPFVMDMRDPWRQIEQLLEKVASPLWLRLAARYEALAVRQASLVLANTELARRSLCATYPARQDDILTIMNGADDDPLPPSRQGGKFIVAHAGTIYLDRNPRALFQAVARVMRELGLTPAEFGLEFIGAFEAVDGFPVREVAQQEGISEYVTVGPLRPHAQAMEFMANATMLITMSGTNAAAIPAKTFECIRFDAWILALSAPESATALLLKGTQANVVAPNDVDGIAAVLRARYQQHAAGHVPSRVANDDRFSRSRQAQILLDAIEARATW